jgi:hypothetical protein
MLQHGGKSLRGLLATNRSAIQRGKFGRLFRWLPAGLQAENVAQEAAVEELLLELAGLMLSTGFNDRIDVQGKASPDAAIDVAEPEEENRTIPAGYTYLGQFIDHDITFDPASSLQQDNDPDALEDFRTPRLDLDSLYGSGPDDQPYLYEPEMRDGRPTGERFRFALGPGNVNGAGPERRDLLRLNNGTAVIGDKRNDENKIVSQIHALFLSFHNRVFDDLRRRPGAGNPAGLFREAQRIVRWCYQWIVVHDYLPRVCRPDVVAQILPSGYARLPDFHFYEPESGEAFLPVEFSVAAFRFGHSMVRPSYKLNDIAFSPAQFVSKQGKPASFARIPILVFPSTSTQDAMNGFGEVLPAEWGVDWSFFFGEIPRADPGVKQVPQPSYRIDTTLVDPLGLLPEAAAELGPQSPLVKLPYRNLLRSFRMGLPSGQDVARAMEIEPLSDEELWSLKGDQQRKTPWPAGSDFYARRRPWISGRAPLWFYLLKEAERQEAGQRLGAVGSRIVAETLIGLIWCDHLSYLFRFPRWNPEVEGIRGLGRDLDMRALTEYVDSPRP